MLRNFFVKTYINIYQKLHKFRKLIHILMYIFLKLIYDLHTLNKTNIFFVIITKYNILYLVIL